MLPLTLVALLLVFPVFAAPTSPNDPFRAISISSQCLLNPPSPPPPAEDDVLLSFEAWKAKQAANAHENERASAPAEHNGSIVPGTLSTPNAPTAVPQDTASDPPPAAPHFRTPLTDRFNYASLDCSARVHLAHPSSKSSSAILAEKRDKYMRSPCVPPDGRGLFIVVELCADIRIDTVQLANFEFFSGVFRAFSVRVAKTYTADDDAWTDAGTYEAKNVRGVQSFHPPTSLRDFYRYIRIDFHSYYGNEFYCPISLLRVYGLTHLEHWKWDMWEAESKARRSELDAMPAPPSMATTGNGSTSSSQVIITASLNTTTQPQPDTPDQSQPDFPPLPSLPPHADPTPDATDSLDELALTLDITLSTESVPTTPENIQSDEIANSASATTTSTSLAVQPTPLHPAAAPTPGGESVYRTIMNRLAALEAAHALYASYVDAHTDAVRAALRRRAADVARLEGIGTALTEAHARAAQTWERQRRERDAEYAALLARVGFLADEIVLEKRLGVAQLCLLLAVLVFMGLTRGSRGHREWEWAERLRARSFGGSRGKLGPGLGLGVKTAVAASEPSSGVKTGGLESGKKPQFEQKDKETAAAIAAITGPRGESVERKSSPIAHPRSRTPSLSAHTPRRPSLTIRTPMRRHSQSAGWPAVGGTWSAGAGGTWVGVGPVPRSARRWARTAHLHEVRGDVFGPRGWRRAEGEGDGWVDTDDADASVDGSEVGEKGE